MSSHHKHCWSYAMRHPSGAWLALSERWLVFTGRHLKRVEGRRLVRQKLQCCYRRRRHSRPGRTGHRRCSLQKVSASLVFLSTTHSAPLTRHIPSSVVRSALDRVVLCCVFRAWLRRSRGCVCVPVHRGESEAMGRGRGRARTEHVEQRARILRPEGPLGR